MMLDLRADIAFNLANIASETNQFKICLKHVRDHLRLRRSLDIGKPLASADTGIAYSSLGLGLLLTGDYEEAIKQCDKSIEIYEKRPETLDRTFYPTFPHIHRALALVGAGRPQEAEAGLLGVLHWREEHCGPDDVQSFKYVPAS
jgi:tetratricopeptide (TPR) repeat protein